MTFDEACVAFRYDPETGVVVNRRTGGTGSFNRDGYRQIGLGRKTFSAHRIAWLLMTGAWPADQIDHVNRVRSDNRWTNLRTATASQNQANALWRTKVAKGVKAHHSSGRYGVRIHRDGVRKFLGYYDTVEEASAAYLRASQAHDGQFARAA